MNDEQLDYRDILLSIYNEVGEKDDEMLFSPYLRGNIWAPITRDNIATYFSNRFTVKRYLIYIQYNYDEYRLTSEFASEYAIKYYDNFYFLILLILSILIDDSDSVSKNLENVSQAKELDMLIQCANENQKYEIQTMLMEYKYKHNLFQKKELEL